MNSTATMYKATSHSGTVNTTARICPIPDRQLNVQLIQVRHLVKSGKGSCDFAQTDVAVETGPITLVPKS